MEKHEYPIVLRLCSEKVENCPLIEIQESVVVIKDDFGGQVSITHEQFQLLLEMGSSVIGS